MFRRLLGRVCTDFVNSMKSLNVKPQVVGKDLNGTAYYETISFRRDKRPIRWFHPKDENNYAEEIPAEWEAWLRHRRKHPPTLEEQQLIRQTREAVQENVRKLEAKSKKPVLLPDDPYLTEPQSRRPQKYINTFVDLEEYKKNPGDNEKYLK